MGVEGKNGSGEDKVPAVERVCVVRRPGKNEMHHIYIFIRSMWPAWITDSRSPFFLIVRIREDFLMGGFPHPSLVHRLDCLFKLALRPPSALTPTECQHGGPLTPMSALQYCWVSSLVDEDIIESS